MSKPIRILGLGGSVRAESVNKRLLGMMLDAAEALGAEVQMADVHSLNLPIFDQYIPLEEQPAQLMWLIDEMKRADGFIICSPTYLGSLTGAVKNTLDSLHVAHGEPRVYFDGRPVALASFGFYGQMNVINSMAFVTRVMGATIVPESVIVSTDEEDANGEILHSDAVEQQILRVVSQLMAMAQDFRDKPPAG